MNKKISKKLVIILPVVLFILLLLFIGIFFFDISNLSPQEQVICNSLKDSGGSTNIVFFATKENAEKYSNYLTTVRPFSSYKDEFNFFYIDSLIPICKEYKGVAVFCYSEDLVKVASACPSDYIAVLSQADSALRSSSYTNVLSINTAHPLTVFVHEIGHSYANFAEEYLDENAKIPRGSLNCVSECEDFGDKADGCFQGCTKQSLYRSTENGLMRTLQAQTYGKFNEFILEEKILREKEKTTSLTGRAITVERRCENEKYYFVEGFYNKEEEKLYIKNKEIRKGCIGSNGEGGFKYKIIDEEGNVIAEGTFNPESIFTDAPGENEIIGETFESTETFVLRVPIIGKTQILEVEIEAQKFQVELAETTLEPFTNENEDTFEDYSDSFTEGGTEVPSTPLGKILNKEGSSQSGDSSGIPPPGNDKELETEEGGSYTGGVYTGFITLIKDSKNSRLFLSILIIILIVLIFFIYKKFLSNNKKRK